MKYLVFLALLLNVDALWAKWDSGVFLGHKSKDGHYSISANFGIEQWENGKRTTHRLQQWYLQCGNRNSSDKPNDYCGLERTVFDLWGVKKETLGVGAMVSIHRHDMDDGTLGLRDVNWKKGKIDFFIKYRDGETTEVKIRFEDRGGTLYLTSFQSIGITRGVLSDSMSAVEYRIPEYTYFFDAPILFTGFKSIEDKRRDEVAATLDHADRIKWEEMKCDEFQSRALEKLKTRIPDIDDVDAGKRQMREDDVESMVSVFSEEMINCLSKAKVSVSAREKIGQFIENELRMSFESEMVGARKNPQ